MTGLNRGLNLTQTMTAVVEGVVDGLGFGVAVISMVQPDQHLQVTAVAGDADARQALSGARSPRSEWDRMLTLATEQGPSGALRLLEHDHAGSWDEELLPSWVPSIPTPAPTRDGRPPWHPLDSLFAPLSSPTGELLAVLSVDLPPDGLLPSEELYALLELFVAQASTALEHARLHTGLVTAHEAARTALASRLQAVIDASPAAIVEVDGEGCVTQWSRSAEQILGYASEEVVGSPVPQRADRPIDMRAAFEWLAAGAELPVVELSWNHPGGGQAQLEVSASPTRSSDGAVHGVMALLVDITERRRLEQQLQDHFSHDPLTGLPNRTAFLDRLRQLTADDDSCVAVLLIDLDRFHEVNDNLGHDVGDELLRRVADRLSQHVTAADLLARIAGDEFALVIADATDDDVVTARCGGLLRALHQTFVLSDDLPVDVEASIGLTFARDENPELVLRRADVAMHEAKSNSAGLVRVGADQLQPPSDRLALLGELRRALDQDELCLHYQPQLDLATGKLYGLEALVRWQHPSRGLLAPAAFLHVAETTGLVTPLTLRVLDLACSQLRQWSERGLDVPVAINLSPRSLYERRLPRHISEALEHHDVSADRLRLEVTESAVMSDPQRARAVLDELADNGMQLALDDFGTGFSSMSHLRDLPATELKIDRSFVSDMRRRPHDQVLVRSTIDLAHGLGLTVIAEGVEDAATMHQLHELGCDVAQGYHIAKPLPVPALAQWLTARP